MSKDTKYVQKSLLFLVPLVMPSKGNIVPRDTYVADRELGIRPNDCKLILTFPKYSTLFTEKEFASFEKSYLINNKYFLQFYETVLSNVYIFDLRHVCTDYEMFLEGKYSHMSENSKVRIIDYYSWKDGGIRRPMEGLIGWLRPKEENFSELATRLGVPIEAIRSVGEILDKPDLSRETHDDFRIKETTEQPTL